MNPKEFTKTQTVNVIYDPNGMHILEKHVYELMQKYADLQLLQTDVMSSACKHDEKNDTKAYAKNGHEFIGYYCEKCDTVYCGSI